jgi:hypothetical protein
MGPFGAKAPFRLVIGRQHNDEAVAAMASSIKPGTENHGVLG